MKFRSVNLIKTAENYFRLEWDVYSDLPGTPESVDDYYFTIGFSNSPNSDFETVTDSGGEVQIDGAVANSYIHELKQFRFDKKRYYMVTMVKKADTSITVDSSVIYIGSETDGVTESIKYAESLVIDRFAGEPALVLIRKITGTRCPDCWSPTRQQRIKSQCDICNGTGFVQGYYSPIPTQISFDSEIKKSISERSGENILDYKKARMSNYPLVSTKDLIINQDTFKRYVVVNVDTTKLPIPSKRREEYSRQNYILSQILTLEELNPDDNEYFVSVDNVPAPLPIQGNDIGGNYPWFTGHEPVASDDPIVTTGQHLTFSYDPSHFEIINGKLTIKSVAVDKQFIYKKIGSGFDNISVTGGSTTSFDAAIKNISGHNNGAGSDTNDGIIVNLSLAHKIFIRDASSRNSVNDGSGNDVYGRLSWTGGNYEIDFYSYDAGSETAYTFSTATFIDIAYVLISENFQDLPWDHYLDTDFHDDSGAESSFDGLVLAEDLSLVFTENLDVVTKF